MTIQPFESNDLQYLAGVQPPDWSDIVPPFYYYTNTDFCFPIKVVLNDTIIGVGATVIHEEVAWLAHIIVSPEHRNKGVGQRITQALTELSRKKNCTTIYLIATDMGAPVYEKSGFETETEYLFFKDIKPASSFIPSENNISFHADFTEQVIQLDREVSGENRAMQLKEHLPNGYVYQKNNRVEGYFLPSFGEGLIIATNPTAGIELMKQRLFTQEHISFPVENSSAGSFLHQLGYKEFKTAKRMRLGIKRVWEPEKIYGRIGGNIG